MISVLNILAHKQVDVPGHQEPYTGNSYNKLGVWPYIHRLDGQVTYVYFELLLAL